MVIKNGLITDVPQKNNKQITDRCQKVTETSTKLNSKCKYVCWPVCYRIFGDICSNHMDFASVWKY